MNAWLDVLVSTVPLSASRWELTGPIFSLGRAPDASVQLLSERVARHHAVLEQGPRGEWTLVSHGSTGTFVNGVSAHRPLTLAPGDFIDLADLLVARFTHAPAQEPARIDALDADPSDEAAWRVWTDALLERGDPLGHWLGQEARSKPELARMMGPLAMLFRTGAVSASWNRFGHLDSLVLPAQTHSLAVTAGWALEHLSLVPGARHLSELGLTANASLQLEAWLELLPAAPLPRSLRELWVRLPRALEPYTATGSFRARAEALLEALRSGCPRLTTSTGTFLRWVE